MIKHYTFKLRDKENNEIIACVNCPLEICYKSLKKAEWLKDFNFNIFISDYSIAEDKYLIGDKELFIIDSNAFNACESYKDFIIATGTILEEIGYDS